jgi:hypothetical protein
VRHYGGIEHAKAKPTGLHPRTGMEAAGVQTEWHVMAQCGQCVSATVKAIEGVGTEHARATAEVTTDDIRAYCGNLASGSDQLASCIKDNATEIGKVQEAKANCSDLTVKPSSGGEYKFSRMGVDYGSSAPTWINLANGKVECGARSCNSATATAHFKLLCPQAIAGWTGRHY